MRPQVVVIRTWNQYFLNVLMSFLKKTIVFLAFLRHAQALEFAIKWWRNRIKDKWGDYIKTIIISINPGYVREIVNGSKRYEYRTKVAKKDVDKLIIYATSPIMKVIGEAGILDVLALSPDELWEETKEFSGITKGCFDNYFKNGKIAYAYKLGKIKVYDEPKELSEFGLKSAPQSFVYAK